MLVQEEKLVEFATSKYKPGHILVLFLRLFAQVTERVQNDTEDNIQQEHKDDDEEHKVEHGAGKHESGLLEVKSRELRGRPDRATGVRGRLSVVRPAANRVHAYRAAHTPGLQPSSYDT